MQGLARCYCGPCCTPGSGGRVVAVMLAWVPGVVHALASNIQFPRRPSKSQICCTMGLVDESGKVVAINMLSWNWQRAVMPAADSQYTNPDSETLGVLRLQSKWRLVYTPQRLCTWAACGEKEPPMGMQPWRLHKTPRHSDEIIAVHLK